MIGLPKFIYQRLKYFLLSLMPLFYSCSGLKTLPDGEKLYTGAKVKIESSEKIKNEGAISSKIKSAIRPKPNPKFLGNRPKVWIYNITDDSTYHGFRKWLHEKVGEPPVLMSSVKTKTTTEIIDAAIFNMGIFGGITSAEKIEKKQKGYVVYKVKIHKPYTISNVVFPADTCTICSAIKGTEGKSILKKGDNYNLDFLRAERKRIDDVLKNDGYFYFNEDYILFKADTVKSNRTVRLTLSLKEDIPADYLQRYRIGDVSVESDYSIAKNNFVTKDTSTTNDVLFIGSSSIRPNVILRSVFLREGEIYSKKNHNITLNRLMGMGTFKFVKVNLSKPTDSLSNDLDVAIHLTPSPKRSLVAELTTISKSNNFLGPALSISLLNRNLLRGAELLKVNLQASIETQIGGAASNVFSYEINPEVEFVIPRFFTPFRITQKRSIFIPKTRFSTSFDYLQRVNFYDLSSLKFQYGYFWKENIKIEHELNPVNINFYSVTSKSDEFQKLLDENEFFKRSYEDQFIAGMIYNYTFNEQVIPNQRSQFALRFTSDLSGNLLTAINALFLNEKANPENPLTVGGIPYSQYFRFTIDLRNYFNLDEKNKIVVRLYTGMGYAYGNSSTLPYIKQFFSGGPSSVRAFTINSLGPGTTPPDSIVNPIYRSGGDLKIESNAEYRFGVYQMIKGALFFDAGNMWIAEKDSTNPYSGIDRSKLISQLAVGTGVGLRLDASFFVLRFDLSMPIRKPWIEANNSWVFNEVDFSSSSWRGENLVLSIALGYPF
jgi:outer membrane protein insertion porin family